MTMMDGLFVCLKMVHAPNLAIFESESIDHAVAGPPLSEVPPNKNGPATGYSMDNWHRTNDMIVSNDMIVT